MSHLLHNAFRELKSHLALILFSILVSLAIVIVYGQDLLILAKEALQNDALTHVFLVPFLIVFLIYRKRELVKASLAIRASGKGEAISLSEISGIALSICALLLYWYGSYTFYPLEYHIASLIIFIIGITRMLLDARTFITLIPPIFLLVFLIPPPSNIILAVGGTLGTFNTQASYQLLRIAGVPASLSSEFGPPTIEINNTSTLPMRFGIDIPCSGIYSLIAFGLFAAFTAYIARGSILKKLSLFVIGFLMLSVINVFRITMTVFIAYTIGEEIAMSMFHLFSGWILLFVGMLLMLMTSERLLHLRIFGRTSEIVSCPECNKSSKKNENFCTRCGKYLDNRRIRLPKRFWIKVTSILLISYFFVLSAQAPVFAFAPKLTISNPNPEASADVFPQVPDYELQFIYRDQNFEAISHQDASLLYAYVSQNVSNPVVYVLVAVADSVTNLHSWESCLFTLQAAQGYSQMVAVTNSRDIQIMQDPPITARYFTFQHPSGYTQVTLYWYQQSLFKTGLTIEPKYARISLIILTMNQASYPVLEQRLFNMSQSIATYWEPLKARSLFSLGIPTLQMSLASIILLIALLQAGHYTREWRKKAISLKIFEKLASPEEKLLYRTVGELRQKTRETTAGNIASAISEATGKAIKPQKLVELLNRLEKNKMINAEIATIADQPRLVWKT